MTALARKTVLPKFTVTTLAENDDGIATIVETAGGQKYSVKVESRVSTGLANGQISPSPYRLYPVVLSGDGSPWPEANLYILSLLDNEENPKMATVTSIAEDLAAYKRFLEEQPSIDWLHFPESRLLRPTYRFNGHLRTMCRSGEVAWSTAKRRMAVVIRLYRWLVEEKAFTSEYPLWKEGERYVHFADRYGSTTSKKNCDH